MRVLVASTGFNCIRVGGSPLNVFGKNQVEQTGGRTIRWHDGFTTLAKVIG